MDRMIIQALQGLVPAISGPLPPELVDLASSLLAQSRSIAGGLKVDEEIARSYVCANIACERLKRNLALPTIEPRPPCPPRVYQKLYRYLDGALAPNPRRSTQSTEPKGRHVASSQRTVRREDAGKTLTPTRISKSRTVKSRTRVSQQPATEDLPQWAIPFTRRLCKKLQAPAASHHVFAGASSILRSLNERDSLQNGPDEIKLVALIIAVTFFVSSRLAGVETNPSELVQKLKVALAVSEEVRGEGIDLGGLTEFDVRSHMRMIAAQKWIEMEWFRNIRVGSGLGLGSTETLSEYPKGQVSSGEEGEQAFPSSRYELMTGVNEPKVEFLRPGLGTMMQPKVDYLSDESLAEYEEWKDGIMARIRERWRYQRLEWTLPKVEMLSHISLAS